MPATTSKERDSLRRRYRNCAIDCQPAFETTIASLSDFFAVFRPVDPDLTLWFRGHGRIDYQLAPSALRYETVDERERALSLVRQMKRVLAMKLERTPDPNDELGWIQVAQHYGLPTRLLDWTLNAAVALFFACADAPDSDGLVVLLNPLDLNQRAPRGAPRLFDAHTDWLRIQKYLSLDGRTSPRGLCTIAISPEWNTPRIAIQHGAFTLHGSRRFAIDAQQASSLRYVPILKEHKVPLLHELARVGMGEMFIFPEPEHVCRHLVRSARLESRA